MASIPALRQAYEKIFVGLPLGTRLDDSVPEVRSVKIGDMIDHKYDHGKMTPQKKKNIVILTLTIVAGVIAGALLITAFIVSSYALAFLLPAILLGIGCALGAHFYSKRSPDLQSPKVRQAYQNRFQNANFWDIAEAGISPRKLAGFQLLDRCDKGEYVVFSRLYYGIYLPVMRAANQEIARVEAQYGAMVDPYTNQAVIGGIATTISAKQALTSPSPLGIALGAIIALGMGTWTAHSTANALEAHAIAAPIRAQGLSAVEHKKQAVAQVINDLFAYYQQHKMLPNV